MSLSIGLDRTGRLLGKNLRTGMILAGLTLSAGTLSWAEEFRPVEQRDLKTIEAAFGSNDLETAEKQTTVFIRSYPKSPLLGSVENIRGLIFLKQRRTAQAIQAFTKALDYAPTAAFQQYILYNLASAQLEGRAAEEAEETLRQIHPELLDAANQLKLITLQASVYERKKQPIEAANYLSGIARQKPDTENKEQGQLIAKLFYQAMQNISDLATLEKLLQDPDHQVLADAILLRLSALEMTSGTPTAATLHLKKLIDTYPKSPHLTQAREWISQIQESSTVDRTAIGVLLPLKGRLAKFGTKSLQGIELALGVFDSKGEPQTPLKLILEDAGEEPETAVQALNRLALKHHVVAVIGPMMSKGVELVTKRAQELGVPLLSLSRRANSTPLDFVFQSGLTQQLQSYEIARHAIVNLGLKKFAILSPNDKLGSESSQAFWDAVESLGGEIVGFESYATSENDFRLPVDKLSGLFYTEARQDELDRLAKERATNNVTKRTRKTEQFFALKPIVDYQAVFIPDDAKRLGQIMPTFSYRDVEGIKFLGTSEWNSADFVSRAQTYGESAYFVDAFFQDTASGQAKKFLEDYRATFNQEPSSLEALAYDAAKILTSLLDTSSNGLTRTEIKDRLTQIREFPGATGRITYKNGQFTRELKVLTVKGGLIKDTKI